jgi:hypothetical protein
MSDDLRKENDRLIAELNRAYLKLGEPVPMRLACEGCGKLHIDEGEFATKPHHTHACQNCGLVWRPAIGPTVGVRFLPGFRNEPPPSARSKGGE